MLGIHTVLVCHLKSYRKIKNDRGEDNKNNSDRKELPYKEWLNKAFQFEKEMSGMGCVLDVYKS